jgi:AbrB family looped-hinge helix DNA binding protein
MRQVSSVITRKGQITIPAEARRILGLKVGDRVAIVLEEDGVKVKPEQSWVERTKGIVKHKGPPLTPQQEDDAVAAAIAEDYAETLKRMAD